MGNERVMKFHKSEIHRSRAYTNLKELYGQEKQKGELQNKDRFITNRLDPKDPQNTSDLFKNPQGEFVNFLLGEVSMRKEDAFFNAASEGRKDEVEKMIAKGIDVNSVDSLGRSAIVGAAKNKHLDVVKTIVKAGADFDSVDEALKVARNNKDFQMVIFLEQGKAVVQVKEDKQQKSGCFNFLSFMYKNQNKGIELSI